MTTTFVYDGEGTRLKKIAGSSTVTRYISKLYECDNGSCTRYAWANNVRIATIAVSNGTVNYWHQDHLDSSAVITDGAGNKVETITYYPYGGTRTNVPYKYTGQELDSTTGLYDYGARQYEPALGRFTSPDTIVPDARDPQVLNRYAYAKNNPLRYNDPSGHEVGDVGGGEFPFFCLWCSPVITPTPDSPAYQYQPAYQQPQVQDMVTQTAEMAMGRNAPKLYGAEFGAAYQDLFGSKGFSSTSLLDFIQAGLSVGGFVPGLNTPTSVLDAGISLFLGDYSGAGLAAVGAIPVLGTLRKFGEGIPEGIRAIEAVRELFAPGGKLIGEAGRSEGVQILSGGKNAIETLFLDAAQHGRLIDKPSYNGLFVDLGQGSFVAYRDSLRHGPTIDFKLPGISEANKFHVK